MEKSEHIQGSSNSGFCRKIFGDNCPLRRVIRRQQPPPSLSIEIHSSPVACQTPRLNKGNAAGQKVEKPRPVARKFTEKHLQGLKHGSEEAAAVVTGGQAEGWKDLEDACSDYINRAKGRIRAKSDLGGVNRMDQNEINSAPKKKEHIKDQFSEYIHRVKIKLRTTSSKVGFGKSFSHKPE